MIRFLVLVDHFSMYAHPQAWAEAYLVDAHTVEDAVSIMRYNYDITTDGTLRGTAQCGKKISKVYPLRNASDIEIKQHSDNHIFQFDKYFDIHGKPVLL